MKHRLLMVLIAFSALAFFGCEKEDEQITFNKCIKGTVIGYEECQEGTLIQLDNINIGNSIVYHDRELGDIEYKNVIKSPGIYSGTIYFKAREYNSEEDHKLFLSSPPTPCKMIYGPYNVPIIVITEFSQIKCPENYEKN